MLKLPPKSPNSDTSLSLFGIPLPGFYYFHSFFFFEGCSKNLEIHCFT